MNRYTEALFKFLGVRTVVEDKPDAMQHRRVDERFRLPAM